MPHAADPLRMRGWLVPAHPMPPAIDDVSVLRGRGAQRVRPDRASLLAEARRGAVDALAHGRAAAGEARTASHP